MRYKDKPSMTVRPSAPAPQPKTNQCEHRYQLIESNTESMYADSKPINVSINAVFYCEKCLDIQIKTRAFIFEGDSS